MGLMNLVVSRVLVRVRGVGNCGTSETLRNQRALRSIQVDNHHLLNARLKHKRYLSIIVAPTIPIICRPQEDTVRCYHKRACGVGGVRPQRKNAPVRSVHEPSIRQSTGAGMSDPTPKRNHSNVRLVASHMQGSMSPYYRPSTHSRLDTNS